MVDFKQYKGTFVPFDLDYDSISIEPLCIMYIIRKIVCNFFFQEIGETALHLAVLRETGDSLYLVDFLVQNLPPGALDKPTHYIQDNLGKSTE